MVTYSIVYVIYLIFKGMFLIMPALPSLSYNSLNNIYEQTIGHIIGGIRLYKYYLGANLFNLTFDIMIAVISFTIAYRTIMWVIKKLPFSIE